MPARKQGEVQEAQRQGAAELTASTLKGFSPTPTPALRPHPWGFKERSGGGTRLQPLEHSGPVLLSQDAWW